MKNGKKRASMTFTYLVLGFWALTTIYPFIWVILNSFRQKGLIMSDSFSLPLGDAFTYVDAYLYIIRERLGERLTITREIDENMLDTQVPRLILQPIVENAVEHDLTPRRGGQLSIRAGQENGFVILEVEHDGQMTAEDLATIDAVLSSPVEDTGISGQIGLRNVRQRLTLLYGEQGTIRLTQPEEGRILARVSFPLF